MQNRIIILKGHDGDLKKKEKERLLNHYGGRILYTNRRELRTYARNNKGEFDIVKKQRKIVEQCLFHNINILIDSLGLTTHGANKWLKIAEKFGVAVETREFSKGWNEYITTNLSNV